MNESTTELSTPDLASFTTSSTPAERAESFARQSDGAFSAGAADCELPVWMARATGLKPVSNPHTETRRMLRVFITQFRRQCPVRFCRGTFADDWNVGARPKKLCYENAQHSSRFRVRVAD